jgi:hypothetical protein
MSKNDNTIQVIQELSRAITELDDYRVAWIFKWRIIDLRRKAEIFLEFVSRLEEQEKETAITAAQEFLTEVAPVIQELNNQKIGA